MNAPTEVRLRALMALLGYSSADIDAEVQRRKAAEV